MSQSQSSMKLTRFEVRKVRDVLSMVFTLITGKAKIGASAPPQVPVKVLRILFVEAIDEQNMSCLVQVASKSGRSNPICSVVATHDEWAQIDALAATKGIEHLWALRASTVKQSAPAETVMFTSGEVTAPRAHLFVASVSEQARRKHYPDFLRAKDWQVVVDALGEPQQLEVPGQSRAIIEVPLTCHAEGVDGSEPTTLPVLLSTAGYRAIKAVLEDQQGGGDGSALEAAAAPPWAMEVSAGGLSGANAAELPPQLGAPRAPVPPPPQRVRPAPPQVLRPASDRTTPLPRFTSSLGVGDNDEMTELDEVLEGTPPPRQQPPIPSLRSSSTGVGRRAARSSSTGEGPPPLPVQRGPGNPSPFPTPGGQTASAEDDRIAALETGMGELKSLLEQTLKGYPSPAAQPGASSSGAVTAPGTVSSPGTDSVPGMIASSGTHQAPPQLAMPRQRQPERHSSNTPLYMVAAVVVVLCGVMGWMVRGEDPLPTPPAASSGAAPVAPPATPR